MRYVCSKSKVLGLALVAFGLGACDLVNIQKAPQEDMGQGGLVQKEPQVPAIASVSAALQESLNSYDVDCQSHSTEVQALYENQIEGKDLSSSELMSLLRSVPDPSGQCLDRLLDLASDLSSEVAMLPKDSIWKKAWSRWIVSEAYASGASKLRLARILRLVFVVHVTRDLGLKSSAGEMGFNKSALVLSRDLNVSLDAVSGGDTGK